MSDAKESIELTGLREYFWRPGRKEHYPPARKRVPVVNAQGQMTGEMTDGEELPFDQHVALGPILLRLLHGIRSPLTLQELLALGKVIDKLQEATDHDTSYSAGRVALDLMRKAVKDNGAELFPYVLAQVLEHIGTGEKELDA